MLRSTGAIITLIICGTVLGLGLLFVMGWLLYTEHEVQTIVSLINLLVTAFLYKRIGDVDVRAARVEQQTNGHTARLMDAALKDKEQR